MGTSLIVWIWLLRGFRETQEREGNPGVAKNGYRKIEGQKNLHRVYFKKRGRGSGFVGKRKRFPPKLLENPSPSFLGNDGLIV